MQISVPFREASSAKYPELVHIVLVQGEDGTCNAMTASWVMYTSIEPPMMAVSIGFERFSHELLKSAGEFVIAFPSEAMEAETRLFGSESGRDMFKIEHSGAETLPASIVQGLLLSDAVANFECRVTGLLETGDHTIFAGEVVASHVNSRKSSRLYVVERGIFGGLRPK